MKRIFLPIMLLLASSVFLFSMSSEKENLTAFAVEFFGNDIITGDTFYVQTNDCLGIGSVCIDIPLSEIDGYVFTDNGANYTTGFGGCLEMTTSTYDYAQLFGQGNLGPYMLDSWQVDANDFSGVFDSIPHLLDSMNLWDPAGNWQLDEVNQIITGGNPSSTYSTMDVTVISISAPTSIPLSQTAIPLGSTMQLTVGTHSIQVVDTAGTCLDSIFVNVVCVQPMIENFILEIDSVHNFCFDHSELLGQPITTEILCPSVGATPADFDLISGNYCVEISALTLGQDSACYVFCDQFGICDTTIIYVEVIPEVHITSDLWFFDEVYVNTTDQVCIDFSDLPGSVSGISNNCPDQSGEYVIYSLNPSTYCVDYIGIDIGTDTACVHIFDNLGNIDTTYVVVSVTNPPIDTVIQYLTVGDSSLYCLDVSQFGGTPANIENYCGSGVGDYASFDIDTANLCVNIAANDIGQDTACFVICDNFSVCDTTILIINISDANTGGLVANNDINTVLMEETLTFNICDNDIIPNGFLTNYYILPEANGGIGPNLGRAEFDGECNIVYIPNGVDCEMDDQFNYVICNTEGCDTGLVVISIMCEASNAAPLEFTNGFSPNGDEVNQHFIIKGADTYPNNTLQIFNRWGNQVFKTENYQNDWDGTWNGSFLQNGTYFYLFNDGNGISYTGFVYIQK